MPNSLRYRRVDFNPPGAVGKSHRAASSGRPPAGKDPLPDQAGILPRQRIEYWQSAQDINSPCRGRHVGTGKASDLQCRAQLCVCLKHLPLTAATSCDTVVAMPHAVSERRSGLCNPNDRGGFDSSARCSLPAKTENGYTEIDFESVGRVL